MNCIISEEQSIVTTNNWILLTLVMRLLACLWRHNIWAKVGNLLISFGTNISRYWVDNLIHIKILPSWILNCMVHLKPYIELPKGPRHCETWKRVRTQYNKKDIKYSYVVMDISSLSNLVCTGVVFLRCNFCSIKCTLYRSVHPWSSVHHYNVRKTQILSKAFLS